MSNRPKSRRNCPISIERRESSLARWKDAGMVTEADPEFFRRLDPKDYKRIRRECQRGTEQSDIGLAALINIVNGVGTNESTEKIIARSPELSELRSRYYPGWFVHGPSNPDTPPTSTYYVEFSTLDEKYEAQALRPLNVEVHFRRTAESS